MKKIALILITALCFVNVNGQTAPPKEQVLKDAKSTKALADINYTAVKKYTWEQLKLQYKEFANGDNLYDSQFRTSQSDQAKLLGLTYDDLGYYYIVATTPKDKDGVYYDVSIQVLYYKTSQNAAWAFKQSKMESNGYYRRGTTKLNDATLTKAIELIKNYKGDGKLGSEVFNIMNAGNFDFIKIDEIVKHPQKDHYITSSQHSYYFYVKGTMVGYAIGTDRSEIAYKYENALVELTISEEADEKGKWKLTSVYMPPRIENMGVGPEYSQGFKSNKIEGEERTAKIQAKPLKIFGFIEVYKKQSTYERSLFSQNDAELFSKKIKILQETLYNDINKGKELLKEFIKPDLPNKDEVYASWVTFFEKAKAYDCELIVKDGGIDQYNGGYFKDDKTAYNYYGGVSISRKSAFKNKDLLKKYKSLGMSKQTLEKNYGSLNSANAEDFTVEFYKNNWYISGVLKLNGENWD